MKFEIAQDEGLNVAFPLFTDTIVKGVEIVESHSCGYVAVGQQATADPKSYTITRSTVVCTIPPVELEFMEGRYFAKHKASSCADGHKSLTEVNPEDGIFDLKQPYNLPFSIAELRNILIGCYYSSSFRL